MKTNPILFPLLTAFLLSDEAFSAKTTSKSNAKPTANSGNSGYQPSQNRESGWQPSKPSSSNGLSPTKSKTSIINTPNGPISPTTKSAYNPSPSFKPLSQSGAPTLRSGGGGFGSVAKTVAVGAAAGAFASIAAGYFLYGGRHSSPYCRGDDMDRFMSGRCPRGQSSQNHECKTQIPLCPIPGVVRDQWNLGADALPKVDVLFDRSLCSLVELPSTPTSAPTSNSTLESLNGVEGNSELDSCLRRIVAAGGCDSYGTGNMFQYDDKTGACGCCSSAQVTTLEDDSFQSAIYKHRDADNFGGVPPKYCISGSIMYYPVSGGADVAHACECGSCTTCGNGEPKYMDWSGPYVVPDKAGNASFVDAAGETQPLYDPVDTCICNDQNWSQCEIDTLSAANAVGGSFSSNVVVVFSTVLFLLQFFRR